MATLPPNSASRLHQFSLIVASGVSLPLALYVYLTSAESNASITMALPLIVFSSLMLLLIDPFVDRKLATQSFSRHLHTTIGWSCASASSWFVGLVAFGLRFNWSDVILLGAGRWVISSILPPSQADALSQIKDEDYQRTAKSKNPLERAEEFGRQVRSVVKTILQNEESRRIYYFLCLNFGYMGIQMMCFVVLCHRSYSG